MKNRKHGLGGTRVYYIWYNMMGRCYDPSHRDYGGYGARGITVDPAWHLVENFFADVGHPPKGATIDRINTHGDYEPGNWRWASRKTQSRNRTTTKLTIAQANQIRAMRASGWMQTVIADHFNVSPQLVCDIIKQRRWT